MANFGVVITGDRRIAISFDTFPQRAHDAIVAKMTEIVQRLEATVRSAIPVKTGKMRSEVTSWVTDRGDKVSGGVGFAKGLPPAEYGKIAALEYGAHGTAIVKAFSAASGKAEESYRRQVNIAEHRFLRGSLEIEAAWIETELRQTIEDALKEE